MKKRGQMQISFGMIFSILLIIFFVAIAFYSIKKLLEFQDSARIINFKNALQNDIDKTWKSSNTPSQEFGKNSPLPSKVKKVCFIDFSNPARENESLYKELKKYSGENRNLFLYPVFSYLENSMNLENIDLEKTTELENPLCFEVINSKISLVLQKNFSESLVTIKK